MNKGFKLNGMWISAALVLSAVMLWGCATSSLPTGGPPDKQGPVVVATHPESGTTGFEGKKITFEFSEFVNRSSINSAIRVEPDLGINYKPDWGRKQVSIEFDQRLPDSVTVIVTIGTDLKDTHGNKMAKPVSVAVSTGERIDKGNLVGNIKNAETGKGKAGDRVLLYREPVNLSERAQYVGESDTSGAVTFSYLSPGRYKAFWVEDRNRNRIWDQEREWAQPFRQEFITLSDNAKDTLGTLYVQRRDTTAPKLMGIGLLSNRRLRLRFSEDIEINPDSSFAALDTNRNFYSGVRPLYRPDKSHFILFAQSNKPLLADSTYWLDLKNIADLAGNPVAGDSKSFTGSAQEDTTLQRIILDETKNGIFDDQPVVITYAAPIGQGPVVDSVMVVAGEELKRNWSGVKTDLNRLKIFPEESWKAGVDYQLRIWSPTLTNHQPLTPTIWQREDLGAVELVRKDTTRADTIIATLRNDKVDIKRRISLQKRATVEGLPPMNYTLTAFEDLNGNGIWDTGRVEPYEPPEPYFIQTGVPVKTGFTGQVTLFFESAKNENGSE